MVCLLQSVGSGCLCRLLRRFLLSSSSLKSILVRLGGAAGLRERAATAQARRSVSAAGRRHEARDLAGCATRWTDPPRSRHLTGLFVDCKVAFSLARSVLCRNASDCSWPSPAILRFDHGTPSDALVAVRYRIRERIVCACEEYPAGTVASIAAEARFQCNGSACTPRIVVFMHQTALSVGMRRCSIPIRIGHAQPIQAMLDTGSTALRILSGAVPSSDHASRRV